MKKLEKKISIKPGTSNIILIFDNSIGENYNLGIIKVLNQLDLPGAPKLEHESKEFTTYKITGRYKKNIKREIIQELCELYQVDYETVKPKPHKPKVIVENVGEIFNGFSGCLITGHNLNFDYI